MLRVNRKVPIVGLQGECTESLEAFADLRPLSD